MTTASFTHVKKRDGTVVPFTEVRITNAIYRAAIASGGRDRALAEVLTGKVVALLARQLPAGDTPQVEQVQDAIEKVLIAAGHAKTAKAFILYRNERAQARQEKDAFGSRRQQEEIIPWRKVWESLNWAMDHRVLTIAQLNQRIAEGSYAELVRECEEHYQLEIVRAADAILRRAATIQRISAERIRDEISRLLTGSGGRRGLELLSESGLLVEILPEVDALRGVEQPPVFHPEGDVWEHTLRMVALLPRPDGEADPRLAWAALLHDVGKAVTRSEDEAGTHFYGHVQRGEEIAAAIIRRLRFSREAMETILALVRGHMLFMNVREMRPNRLKRLLRTPDFALHLELHRLDCLASHGLLDHYEFCRQKLEEYPEEELRPPRLLTGRDLIEMGFAPSPVFKEILRAVEDAQLGGEIADASGARDLVRVRWGEPKRRES